MAKKGEESGVAHMIGSEVETKNRNQKMMDRPPGAFVLESVLVH